MEEATKDALADIIAAIGTMALAVYAAPNVKNGARLLALHLKKLETHARQIGNHDAIMITEAAAKLYG